MRQTTEIEDTARARNRAAGFTLIELMIVVLITLIVLGMCIPSFQRYMESYKLQSGAQSVSSTISMARMMGSQTFSRSMIYYDPTLNMFTVQLRPYGGSWSEAMMYSTSKPTMRMNLPDGITLGLPPSASVGPGSGGGLGTQSTVTPKQCTAAVFSSRGFPIYDTTADSAYTLCNANGTTTDGAFKYDYVVYLKSWRGAYKAVVVEGSGKTSIWDWDISTSTWKKRLE